MSHGNTSSEQRGYLRVKRPGWQERLCSVGCAQSIVKVRIGDEEGNPLRMGKIGEIMVYGQTVMGGYWNNPSATSNALLDGRLMTGEMGSIDKEGYITLKDRSKDMIISGGTNIYPREVKEALLTHRDVKEVSVFG